MRSRHAKLLISRLFKFYNLFHRTVIGSSIPLTRLLLETDAPFMTPCMTFDPLENRMYPPAGSVPSMALSIFLLKNLKFSTKDHGPSLDYISLLEFFGLELLIIK